MTDKSTEETKDETKYPKLWEERIGPFALAVGKTIDEITEKLTPLVGEPGDEALTFLADAQTTPDADIKAAFSDLKIPTAKLNFNISKLRGMKEKTEASPATSSMQIFSILPTVPDETSFLEMLKIGGVLKVGETEVLAAVKAALANGVGLFKIPEKMLKRMEEYSEAQMEPCGEMFFEMQKLITENKYGDVLSALGVPGKFMNETRKNAFFVKIDNILWASLSNFHSVLNNWQDSWMKNINPNLMMSVAMMGQNGAALPPNMMAPPDTSSVRASGEEVINDINKIFAGPGIPVARALAYDATRIMNILNNEKLPAQLGATSRDQMLKDLGIGIGSEIVRTEQSITRYALSVMMLPKVTAENEAAYLTALNQLGLSIPWEKIGVTGRAGIGRKL